MRRLAERAEVMPFGGIVALSPLAERAARDAVLELEDIHELVGGVLGIHRLHQWLAKRADDVPTLANVGAPLCLSEDFVDLCSEALDEFGELSAVRWPELGRLRTTIRDMGRAIRARMEELIRGDELADHLQDRFVTERDGRFVVPLKASSPRNLGIVHATSNTGETVFVEPGEIVARSNRLRESQAELERLERRVLAEISTVVAREATAIAEAEAATVHLDLLHARQRLGERLHGRLPEVGSGGVLRLRAARHPALVLRGVNVVPNDLSLDSQHPCLLLTGPNTGGKTVALKTLGLAALFCRCAIPFPAEDGTRIDIFPSVVADIGDIQTVQGDLSTFSGHISILKATLAAARPQTLVLLDEVGVGTDPSQGAPLARAIVEALVDTGARVCVTTHYAEVKALSAADARFAIAAMQYAHGRPTYRVAPGHAGQSHAFAIARSLDLPEAIVERARGLMDQGARQLSELMEELEAQQAEVRLLREALDERDRVVSERERKLEARRQSLEARKVRLEQEIAERFTRRLRDREDEVKGLVAALQQAPDLDLAGRTLKQIRDIREEVAKKAAPRVPNLPPPPKALAVGDPVLVRSLAQRGVVTEVLGNDRFAVRVGVLPMKLKRAELARIDARGQVVADDAPAPAPRPAPPVAAPPPAVAPTKVAAVDRADLAGLRLDSNTLDLRGVRLHDAMDQIPLFLDRMTVEGRSVAFVLHGHGTGALKKAVRDYLPTCGYITGWRPCDPGEGGDAYTIVGLR